jgi:hypothetical protein
MHSGGCVPLLLLLSVFVADMVSNDYESTFFGSKLYAFIKKTNATVARIDIDK